MARRLLLVVAAYAVLALVVVGWGWLLTHSLEGSIEGTDDDVSRWFAGQRTSWLDPVAEAGTLLGETVVGLAVGAVVAVVAGLALRSCGPPCCSSRWRRRQRRHLLARARTPTRAIARRCASSTRAGAGPQLPVGSRRHRRRGLRRRRRPARALAAEPRACGRARTVVVVLLACVPLFVAVSRLYQGAHHLTDVGTSLVYGTIWLAVLGAPTVAASRPCHDRRVDTQTRQYRTGDREVVLDLTRDCAAYVADRGDGLLQLFVPHATAGIAIIETGAGSDDDLLSALGDLLPADDRWKHAHGSRGHGRSHVMPAFVPPYATVPVLDGRLALGTWQSICLVDLNVDNDERTVRFSFLAG